MKCTKSSRRCSIFAAIKYAQNYFSKKTYKAFKNSAVITFHFDYTIMKTCLKPSEDDFIQATTLTNDLNDFLVLYFTIVS